MPSAQVSLVIETEKKAAQIEQDARIRAQEILDAAKSEAASNRSNMNRTADTTISNIQAAARLQADTILKKEELSAADLISALQSAANQNKARAVNAAVRVLSGRA